jgi:hypothetical protein
MSKKLISQLKNLRSYNGQVNPDRSWVVRNRQELLIKIENSSQEDANVYPTYRERMWKEFSTVAHLFVPSRILVMARTSLTVTLVATVAVSGWIASVSASQDSLPGEVLYGVKIATEKTELIVASVIGSEESVAATNLKHAAKKVEEYKKAKSSKQAAVSIKSLKKKIESTSKSLKNTENQSSKKAVAVALVIEEKTSEILDALGVEAEINNQNDSEVEGQAEENLAKDVSEVEGLLEDAGVKAVKVLIEKNDEVKDTRAGERLEKKLGRIVTDLAELDIEIGNASDIVGSSTTLGNISLDIVSGTTAVIELEENETDDEVDTENSTEEVTISSIKKEKSTNTEQNLRDRVQEVGQQVGEATKKGEETVVEVKTLIENNDLQAALEKVQELKNVKNVVTGVVAEVQNEVGVATQVAEDEEVKIETETTAEVEEENDQTVSEEKINEEVN